MRVLILLVLGIAPASAQTEAASQARAHGEFVRALTAQALGDDSTAARVLDGLLERGDDATLLAVRAQVARDPAEAVFFARRAADLLDRADVLLTLARSYQALGQLSEAAETLDQARQLAPDDLDVALAGADVAAQRGDADAEHEALVALVRLGDTVAARLRLSALAEARGDLPESLAQARAALRLAPSEPAVRRRVAALEDRGAPGASPDGDGPPAAGDASAGGGIDALLDEIDRDPRDLAAWVAVLDALAAASDPRAAATADDAMLLFSSVPAIVASAADAYLAAGDPEAAQAAAQRGLDALGTVGDSLPDADALRARLAAFLSR